jgi:hypothetical protein
VSPESLVPVVDPVMSVPVNFAPETMKEESIEVLEGI